MQDVQRFIAIKRLHETGGLPLVESAARALKAAEDNMPSATVINESDELDGFWAGLIDTLPELLLVIDGSGRIAAANEVARAMLNIRYGSPFTSLAPGGWRRTYNSLRRDVGTRHQPVLLAMRARTGIVFMNAQVVLLGRVLDGRAVFIGTRVRGPGSSESAVARDGSLHG
jgi:PAS domain-containing protein